MRTISRWTARKRRQSRQESQHNSASFHSSLEFRQRSSASAPILENGLVTPSAPTFDRIARLAHRSGKRQPPDTHVLVLEISPIHTDAGTIVQIVSGLPAPKPVIVGFAPASGKVGQKVTISGGSFVGTTAVAFNGTPASFTVKSTNTVTATVPSGATSGPVTVTNAGGSTTSTKSFTVVP
jgi:hypothetical protein